MAKPAKQPGMLSKLLKSVPKNEYTKPLTELFEAHRQGGRPVSESLKPTAPPPSGDPLPVKPTKPIDPRVHGTHTPGTPAFQKAIDTYNDALRDFYKLRAGWADKVREWNKQHRTWANDQIALEAKRPIAEKLMQPGANLGVGAERVRNAEVLAEMIRQRTGKGGDGTGTLHTDLAKVQRRLPGRVARGVGGTVGGTVGGLLTDWLVNLLQNRGAQAAGGAPTLDNK